MPHLPSHVTLVSAGFFLKDRPYLVAFTAKSTSGDHCFSAKLNDFHNEPMRIKLIY